MSSDEKQIRQLMQDWHLATKKGDLDAVLALMTDDVVFLTPGNPPMSKKEFADSFRSFAGRVQLDITQDVKEIHVGADIAYSRSFLSVGMTTSDPVGKTERAGHVLTVFRKSTGGKWLLARDANLMTGGKPKAN